MHRPTLLRALPSLLVTAAVVLSVITLLSGTSSAKIPRTLTGIHKIQHIVIIMMENRSFDEYFGTYPGAGGIPMKNGVPTACLPDPRKGHCQRPYHDTADMNGGGNHEWHNYWADLNGGKMDGFISQAEK